MGANEKGFGTVNRGFYPELIDNSARFDGAAYSTFTPASAGDRQKFELSGWIKRSDFDTNQVIVSAGTGGPTSAEFIYSYLRFDAGNRLQFFDYAYPTTYCDIVTSRVFRDPSALFHYKVTVDTTQATASDRVKIEINGELETSLDTAAYPALNRLMAFNNNVTHYISLFPLPNGGTNLSGYAADLRMLDGITGQTYLEVKNGVPIPKSYTGAYGTNGWHLEFNGTTTDSSGNGNDWTATGIASWDYVPDTPTNKWCTLNPLYNSGAAATFSQGNLRVSQTSPRGVGGSLGVASGKYYWEVFCEDITDPLNVAMIGVVDLTKQIAPSTVAYATEFGWTYYAKTGDFWHNNASTPYGSIYTDGAVIGICLDVTNETLEFSLNGVSQGVFAITLSGGIYGPLIEDASLSATIMVLNAGQDSTFAGNKLTGSANATDANGYGDFYYTPPAGALALCAANLPETTISPNGATQVEDYYGAVEDTESNIAASVAALRTGWPNYFELMKNLANPETWAWRFSHDSGNEYAVSTTATYQAARALSGTDSWIGYTVKIDPACGTAAGSQAHTSGTPTTITHNLGEARGFILLFPRAGGAVYAYHPDLPAGQLLILTSTAAAAANTTITNVAANSFDIGSGVTTGTYDYLIMTEVDGFFELGEYTGNASTDGPFDYGDRPNFVTVRRIETLSNWYAQDATRSPENVVNDFLSLDTTTVEQSTVDCMDFLSNGMKIRNTNGGWNASGGTYVYFKITEQPVKCSNAR